MHGVLTLHQELTMYHHVITPNGNVYFTDASGVSDANNIFNAAALRGDIDFPSGSAVQADQVPALRALGNGIFEPNPQTIGEVLASHFPGTTVTIDRIVVE